MKKIIISITLVFSFIPIKVFCQVKKRDYSNQQWLFNATQLNLSKKFFITGSFNYRWEKDFSNHLLSFGSLGAGYHISNAEQLFIGMARVGIYSSNTLSKTENRPFQYLLYTTQHKTISISQRFQIEERFIKNLDDDSNHFNFRFRYRLICTLPIIKINDNQYPFKVSLDLGDEIFINSGKEITYNTFDQNRLYGGPSLQFHKNLSAYLYYNYQVAKKNKPDTYNINHVIWLGFKQIVDVSKRVKTI